MNARRIDQIWLFGGLALVVLLVVAGWFLLISPKYVDEAKAQVNTEETAAQLSKARSSFAGLKAETKKLNEYQNQLKEYQAALPISSKTNGIPAFLKQLQTLGTKMNVEVSGYSASVAVKIESVNTVTELPITLNVDGDVEDITRFVKQLQSTQPRAVMINSATLGSDDNGTTLSLTLNAYVTSTVTEKVS
ncbi:type 4a pilus biogenesis protein PilO [Actinoplanes sp. GCM10030250]|uniref:type 4a pilus biogenesis protein PilO n=1 Tax=Actinoplanes sp. GCM10030250 TaxID=3273376 RepID=UPI003612100E